MSVLQAPTRGRALLRFRLIGIWTLITLAWPHLILGANPDWWTSRSVLDLEAEKNDFAPLNQGQLKNIALGAFLEFEAKLPGGAGAEITNAISAWVEVDAQTGAWIPKNAPGTNDFALMNVGQLKTTLAPFRQRILDLGYPASEVVVGPAVNDFAPANIGQTKNAFAFSGPVPLFKDSDNDGLPDWFEKNIGSNPHKSDSDGDGVPDGADSFPLDPTRASPIGGANDDDPPIITLTAPAGAVLIP